MSGVAFLYFDLGNVLVRFDRERGYAAAADRLGVPAASVREVLEGGGLQARLEAGSISVDAAGRELMRSLGRGDDAAAGVAGLRAAAEMFEAVPETIDRFNRVAASSVGVGILSNTSRVHWAHLTDTGSLSDLKTPDVTVLSFDVGAIKPHPAVYEAAEMMAEVDPTMIGFVDDLRENIDAATARGWQAIQARTPEETLQAVDQLVS